MLHSVTIRHLTSAAKFTTNHPVGCGRESVWPKGFPYLTDSGYRRKRLVEIVTASAAQRVSELTVNEVVAEIAVALQPFKKGDVAITAATDISQDLNMDSLAVMDLLMELEDKFDVSIPLNMVPEIATVGQLAQTVISSKKGA